MKLFQLFKRYAIIIMFAVLVIGSIAHFFIFRFFIHRSTDDILYEHKQHVENYVALNDTLVPSSKSVIQPPRVEEHSIDNPEFYPEMLKDTVLYSESTGEFVPYRQLYFTVTYKGKSYLVNINQPTVETDDLLYAVVTSLIILFFLFILFTYILGKYVKNKLWAPFYKLLNAVQSYDFQKTEKLQLYDSGIVEFDDLNHVINRMVAKIHADYLNLKEFTEDASHEMQTPLSIIKSKIDLLIQGDITPETSTKVVQAMSNAVTRLSKLNRSLLLLAKINNNQFDNKQLINFTDIIENYLEDLHDLIDAKRIEVNFSKCDFYVEINPELAEIVISNLFSNAIKYNVENGQIEINITNNGFTIGNTTQLSNPSADLFSRFSKQKSSADSIGLGLNIVKSICDTNGLNASYTNINGEFVISIQR